MAKYRQYKMPFSDEDKALI